MAMHTLGTGITRTLIWCGGLGNSAMPTSRRLYLLTGVLHPLAVDQTCLGMLESACLWAVAECNVALQG